ncbi:MAG: hypothetical protein PVH29_12645 [Candidatus Zixiibacteriota bacterium]
MLKNWTVLLLALALPAAAGADKNDRWHRHSAFGWAVNGYGQYYLQDTEGERMRGPVFGLRLVCTPIREDRAAFDFAVGVDAGEARGNGSSYTLGAAYGDLRAYFWLWGPFYVQGGAGLAWAAPSDEDGNLVVLKRNVGKSYFAGPAFQLSPAFMLLPEWRWDEIPYGHPAYVKGRHESWRILINFN